jgi:hypothetical protein
LIFLYDSKDYVLISKCTFYNNSVVAGVFIIMSPSVLIEQAICSGQNKNSKGENDTLGGPCFHLVNVLKTNFNLVTVENGFASSNTVGLKLIFNSSYNPEEQAKGPFIFPKFISNSSYNKDTQTNGALVIPQVNITNSRKRKIKYNFFSFFK